MEDKQQEVKVPAHILSYLVRAAESCEVADIRDGCAGAFDDSIRSGLEWARENGLSAPEPTMAQKMAREAREVNVLIENRPFQRKLEQLLNSVSAENGSNTPDFILASLLTQTLKTFELHTVERDRWYGNRSLLGPGSGIAEGSIQASEKTLLPGIDITKPRDLVGEALGTVPGSSSYSFATVPEWKPTAPPPLDIPTGLTGAVNNLYSFHDKFEVPWITDEPTWPGEARVALRERLNDEEFGELGDALRELRAFMRGTSRGSDQYSNVDHFSYNSYNILQFRPLMAAVAKEIVDCVYVLVGMAGEMGIDVTEVWKRVHASNMSKNGEKRADGKQLKGPGYTPADVEGAIFKTP